MLTSSEGAIHAPHYLVQAADRRFTGLVLTGAPGRSVGQVARSQIRSQVTGLSNGALPMDRYDAAIAAFVADEPIEPDPSLPEGLRPLLFSLANPVNLPFARELRSRPTRPTSSRRGESPSWS